MQAYLAVTVKYLPATTHKQSRLSLKCHRFNERVIIPYDFGRTGSIDNAIAYLQSLGHTIVGYAELSKHLDVIFTDTFRGIKKPKPKRKR